MNMYIKMLPNLYNLYRNGNNKDIKVVSDSVI